MKITRSQLRRIIKEELSRVLIEDKNPGSHFAAAETKGKETSEKEIKAKWSKRIQKTYDWFMDEVFPAIEAKRMPITTKEQYVFHLYGQGGKTKLSLRPSFDMAVFFIPTGTSINAAGEIKSMVLSPGWRGPRPFSLTLEEIWDKLESIGTDPGLDLDVQMTSDAGEDLDSD